MSTLIYYDFKAFRYLFNFFKSQKIQKLPFKVIIMVFKNNIVLKKQLADS